MLKNVLILIPCCGSKRSGGITEYNASTSILRFLSNSAGEKLLQLRQELFERFSIPMGQDVIVQSEIPIEFLEAHRRYTGTYSQLYREISLSSWEKVRTTSNLTLLIVSALYGLLRFDESIRNYNKAMSDKVGPFKLKTWWKHQRLCEILLDFIRENQITEVHHVLSNDYSMALSGCKQPSGVEFLIHDFSQYGSGSNNHRGKWVNTFIRNFEGNAH